MFKTRESLIWSCENSKHLHCLEINKNFNISSYQTLKNCLFGAVKLTKHVDIDLYKYSGYGIGFDRKWFSSIGDEVGRNVITFGVDMSSFSHIDNKKKDILNIRTYTGSRKIVFNRLH